MQGFGKLSEDSNGNAKWIFKMEEDYLKKIST